MDYRERRPFIPARIDGIRPGRKRAENNLIQAAAPQAVRQDIDHTLDGFLVRDP